VLGQFCPSAQIPGQSAIWPLLVAAASGATSM